MKEKYGDQMYIFPPFDEGLTPEFLLEIFGVKVGKIFTYILLHVVQSYDLLITDASCVVQTLQNCI